MSRSDPASLSNEYWDKVINLIAYKYRYYSPVLGRFINRDPIGEKGGLNLYGFVLNNPIYRSDWNGILAILIWLSNEKSDGVWYINTGRNGGLEKLLEKIQKFSDSFDETIDECQYKRSRKDKTVRINGESVDMNYREFRKAIARELSSSVWVVHTEEGEGIAYDSAAGIATEPYDKVVIGTHGHKVEERGEIKGGYYHRFGERVVLAQGVIDEVQVKNSESVADMSAAICYSNVKDNQEGTQAI